MDAARIELKLALGEAGLPDLILETFSQRLNVQKRLYLVQVLGYDLGYRFSWYLRGPYCSDLTENAFALRGELQSGDSDADNFILSKQSKETIAKATELWNAPTESGVGKDDWLELLASLHYLKEVAYWPPGTVKSFTTVFKKLVDAKPRFANEESIAQQAWNRLEKFELITAA